MPIKRLNMVEFLKEYGAAVQVLSSIGDDVIRVPIEHFDFSEEFFTRNEGGEVVFWCEMSGFVVEARTSPGDLRREHVPDQVRRFVLNEVEKHISSKSEEILGRISVHHRMAAKGMDGLRAIISLGNEFRGGV